MSREKIKKKKKKNRTGLKIFLLIIILIIAICAGVFIYKINENGGGTQALIATVMGHNPEKLKNLEPLYFVVLGESVAGDSRLTDTIIVCKYDPKTQQAAMMSIPRDTYTGTGSAENATAYYKINNSYGGGETPENTVKVVNRITGLNIKYYVWVNTNVLKELVDEIGGVYFDVPIDMHYTDTSQDLFIRVDKGYQLLNGDKAEQVVRFRHNDNGTTYPSSYGVEDYGRMKTQREFIKATLEQTLKPEHILKIGNFMNIAFRNIKTNISMDVAKDYLPYVVKFSTENLRTGVLPGSDTNETGDESWLFFPSKSGTKKLVDQLFLNPDDYDDEGNEIDKNAINTISNTTSTDDDE